MVKSPTGKPSKMKPAAKAFDKGSAKGGKRPVEKPVEKKKKKKGGLNYKIEDALRRSGA